MPALNVAEPRFYLTMHCAFYAPLKSPSHSRPSGDRRIAQLLMEALRLGGWEVELASDLRSFDGDGCAQRQNEIKTRAAHIVAALIADYRARSPEQRPRFWFTYHPYHKSPDWLGPAVSAELGIPYVVAEISLAQKQRRGNWHLGHAQTVLAAQRAALIFCLNSNDWAGVAAVVRDEKVLVSLKPFSDLDPDLRPDLDSDLRQKLAAKWQLQPQHRWLVCVAMMRRHSKLDSYRILADATNRLKSTHWQLIVVGDGEAETEVRGLFARNDAARVRFLGRLENVEIHALMRASDLLVWPACNEAFGMAILEAMGCGLPVVAGRSGGVGDLVGHGVTGVLVDNPHGANFAAQVDDLLAQPTRLRAMATAALEKYQTAHQIQTAAEIIRAEITSIIGEYMPKSALLPHKK